MPALPFHSEFQRMAFGYIWRHTGALQAYAECFQASFFKESGLASLCGLVFDYYTNHRGSPSLVTVLELIRSAYPDENREDHTKQRNLLTKLARECSSMQLDDPAFIDAKLRNFMGWSAIRDATLESAESIKEGKYDPEVVVKFQKAAQLGVGVQSTGLLLKESVERVVLEETDPNQRKRIPTGLIHFDTELGGGTKGGELAILMAPPKGFKSGTMLNIAHSGAIYFSSLVTRNITQIRKRPLYITLELSEELQIIRFAYRTTGMEKAVMREDPRKFIDFFHQKSASLYPESEVEIKFFAPYTCTPNTIRKYLDQQRAQGIEYGMIVIDYLDLMGSDRKLKEDYLEKVLITTEIRQIGKDYDVPVWSACRTTKEATGKKFINMAHMSGAFERVAIADYCYALCQTTQERVEGKIRLVPIANRNESGMRVICCNFRPEVMTIESVESVEMDPEEVDGGAEEFKSSKRKAKKKFQEAEETLLDLEID